ncbi:type II toxin-antitoxin system Phd/YefM family antitoxin [Candidatus Azambacteria bacterium]|nr:type II toxin-antitoxin system Phd/YefM family antitoxin [Candidatus Azambacteria bacterium]
MLTKIKKSIGVSELRKNLPKYFKDAKKEPVVVSDRGRDVRVIMDVDLYNSIIESYEDHRDEKALERLVKKDKGERVGWKDIKDKYICK